MNNPTNSKSKAKVGKPNAQKKSRGNFRDKDDRFTKDKTDEKRACHNDPKWYVADGQLAKDVASLSFNTALGSSFMLSSDNLDSQWTIPGIMSILTMPTGGASMDDNSPINIAARKVYSYVRHANSGHSNYDPADLMMYLLAMDSIYIYWSWMVRLYGTLQVYSQTNRYVGDALIHAMGANAESLRQNLANFRAYINMFAVKASTFAVPKTMSLFIRHSWMYSNVYKDEDVSKSQFYVYAPAGVYKWAPTISAGGSGLQPINIAAGESTSNPGVIDHIEATNNTYVNITAIGNQLINALLGNEDIGIMSGDILKAYGAENLWRLETIPEGYAVIPVYSEEVLAQIHNTEICSRNLTTKTGDPAGLQAFTIFQDNTVGSGIIKQDIYCNSGYHMLYDKVLDFWKQDPTPEDVLVATRNTYVAERNDGESKALSRNVHLTSYGSEIAVSAFILKYNLNGLMVVSQVFGYDGVSFTTIAPEYMCFNEPPVRLVCNSNGVVINLFGGFDTYAPLPRSTIKQLHESALLAMYGVPALK